MPARLTPRLAVDSVRSRAAVIRELDRYVETWREQVEADPRGGDEATVHRAMIHVLKTLPPASAISARDPEVFGEYLCKPSSLFERRPSTVGMRELLHMTQKAATMKPAAALSP